jgi:hypothetical protein
MLLFEVIGQNHSEMTLCMSHHSKGKIQTRFFLYRYLKSLLVFFKIQTIIFIKYRQLMLFKLQAYILDG